MRTTKAIDSSAAPDLLVTLISVTFNSERDLQVHWKNDLPSWCEWIVVDNASTDSSVSIAKTLGARTLTLPRNVGFSSANNAGAALASGQFLLFVNPDVTVDFTSLPLLLDKLRQNDVVVAPQLLNADGSQQENGRGEPYLFYKLAHFLGTSVSQASYEITAAVGEVKSVEWAIGAALCLRRETFFRLGGWDSGYFIYYEDSDICLRASAAGVPTLLCGDVRWVHGWARETRSKFKLSAWKFEFRSASRFYWRHPKYLGIPVRAIAQGRRTR